MRRYEHVTDSRRAEVRTDIVTRYNSGQSIRDIAFALGRSYGFVHRMLLEEDGLELRSRGALGRRQQAAAASAVLGTGANPEPELQVSVSKEEEEVDLAGESENPPPPPAEDELELELLQVQTAEPAFAEDSSSAATPSPSALTGVMAPSPTLFDY
jgi:hypothetical protein